MIDEMSIVLPGTTWQLIESKLSCIRQLLFSPCRISFTDLSSRSHVQPPSQFESTGLGLPHSAFKVAPAFQWAQNDTCIFLNVKFTVRWNAPGALEARVEGWEVGASPTFHALPIQVLL